MIWRLRTRAKTMHHKMLLRREINTLKLGSGEPISMYVARAEDLYKNFTAAGSDMKPEELAFAILGGLPDEYGSKKGFAYKKGRSGSSGGGSESSVSCYWCGRAHKLTECKVSKKIECRNCQKTGHIQVVCWKKHGKPTGAKFGGKGKPGNGEKGVAFTAHEEVGEGAWILDLGCTQHPTGDKGKFKTLEAVGSRIETEFGNKQFLAAEGVGEVELRCVTLNSLSSTSTMFFVFMGPKL
jgi:hypothetical protein